MNSDILTTDNIISLLSAENYRSLFMSERTDMINKVWENGKNQIALIDVINKKDCAHYTRFLVSEILFTKSKEYPDIKLKETIAPLYAEALTNSTTSSHQLWVNGNQWGFMYYGDENNLNSYGDVGKHLLIIGKPLIPHLVSLFDNAEIIFYEGSKEATLGNSLAYRVKDAAAYYIGIISGKKVQFHEQNSERDREITMLKKNMGNC